MAKKGILVDMNYCTGCHACEVACKQENDFPVGIYGIKITEMLMSTPGSDRVQFDYVPYFSHNCNLCASRIASGEDTRPSRKGAVTVTARPRRLMARAAGKGYISPAAI